MMLGERDSFGREDERVATVAVGFRECAVNGDGVAAALDRLLALLDFHRDVAVDDERVPFDSKFAREASAEVCILYELEVRILRLLLRRFIFDKVSLERRHPIFA